VDFPFYPNVPEKPQRQPKGDSLFCAKGFFFPSTHCCFRFTHTYLPHFKWESFPCTKSVATFQKWTGATYSWGDGPPLQLYRSIVCLTPEEMVCYLPPSLDTIRKGLAVVNRISRPPSPAFGEGRKPQSSNQPPPPLWPPVVTKAASGAFLDRFFLPALTFSPRRGNPCALGSFLFCLRGGLGDLFHFSQHLQILARRADPGRGIRFPKPLHSSVFSSALGVSGPRFSQASKVRNFFGLCFRTGWPVPGSKTNGTVPFP